MARPLRTELAGALYHVTARGDRREAIYLDDADRQAWLSILGGVCERFNWRCHAYCLMTNHYHFVVETPEANLSQGMRQLNGVYTQQFNRSHGSVGHVFQGRYKAILVEKDSYLLELARYVVLNPVRAEMVSDAGDWPWRSYPMTTGTETTPAWLETRWLLGQFHAQREKAWQQYIDFVRAGVGLPSLWQNLKSQVFLGSDAFIDQVKRSLPQGADIDEIPRTQRRPVAAPLSHYATEGPVRDGMARAYLSGDYTMKAIAQHFGVHYATVSRAVKRFEGGRKG